MAGVTSLLLHTILMLYPKDEWDEDGFDDEPNLLVIELGRDWSMLTRSLVFQRRDSGFTIKINNVTGEFVKRLAKHMAFMYKSHGEEYQEEYHFHLNPESLSDADKHRAIHAFTHTELKDEKNVSVLIVYNNTNPRVIREMCEYTDFKNMLGLVAFLFVDKPVIKGFTRNTHTDQNTKISTFSLNLATRKITVREA